MCDHRTMRSKRVCRALRCAVSLVDLRGLLGASDCGLVAVASRTGGACTGPL